MSRNNYHTHTVFCDGQDTPEALVQYAIAHGCTEIGFSSHSPLDIPDDEPFSMTQDGAAKYRREVNRLKEVYRDRIRILLGVEQDYFSTSDTSAYDYVIGSVHYVWKDGCYICVDFSRDAQKEAVHNCYHGDFYAFAEDYYALVGDLCQKTKCDIIGHFDLITKFNEGDCLFDTKHPRYVAAYEAALEKLFAQDVTFEVNYGAIARGYRKEPYPASDILQKVIAAGKQVIYSSDCHGKDTLLLGIPEGNVWKK